jgi:AraC family transcriptional activator of pobA
VERDREHRAMLEDTRLLRAPRGAAPVYTYERVPGVPSVGVVRFDCPHLPPGAPSPGHAHSHDFLVLSYCERSGGSLRLDGREMPMRAGDVHLIPPGVVVGAGQHAHGLRDALAWAVYFPADVIDTGAPGSFLSWRAHPLLFPFARGAADGAQRLRVPEGERGAWSARIATLERELRARADGYRDAAMAHLTLLLVDVSRLSADVVGDLRLRDEPLLARVFDVIEARYATGLSLADVARAVSLTPGHLTTVVRHRTGRTVGEWITERRMAQARQLLVQTDRSVAEIARDVGYADASYFVRRFRACHSTTPLRWRRAAAGI